MKDYEKMWTELMRELQKIEEGDDVALAKIAREVLRIMVMIEEKHRAKQTVSKFDEKTM
ncbi:hypothetical protein P9726_06790 [Geobacillus stearothermophilus]|uniref:hypothetical protein n=1 Tax=Geobacillus stearothermophilus TaxID=1422 RepID=UPI002E1AAE24|nr:hypothetical protein [Geobacillus stearothermophilus]